MSTALHSGIAIAQMGRNLGKDWNLDGSGLSPILENSLGNRYWLKMQDGEGRVWDDAAGGLNVTTATIIGPTIAQAPRMTATSTRQVRNHPG